MLDEQIKIQDESGDRKYFTIIPNYILNHSSATAQALYLQLKRLAGESGVAYPSSRYLRERLKISQPTLRNEIQYLIQRKWIKYTGETDVETDGGKQKIKSYKIVDLWKQNAGFYQERGVKIERGERIATPRGEKIDTQGVKESAQRGERIAYKEEPVKKELSFKKNIINEQSSLGNKVNIIISFFKEVNPSYERLFANKNQRSAVERLIKKIGEEKLEHTIKVLSKTNETEYAPIITSPIQLENKLGSLIAFIKKDKKNKNLSVNYEPKKYDKFENT